jgi:glucose/arabinose dehydrogenase
MLLVTAQLPATPPPDFQSEVLITGLVEPTGLTFAPDGRMLIIERGGRIHVVLPGALEVEPTSLLQLTNINIADGERGLVGIALDPGFSTNGFYYVFYTADSPLRDRVSRFTASGSTTVPGSESIIWEDNVPSAPFHHGGTIAFGPDGHLYISTGDHFNASDSQSLTSYHGKILRIRSNGSIPEDNPFFDGSGSNLDEIWALGLRNPFRFSFDPMTGRMYIGDVGANDRFSSIEEVNVGAAGANYGWPLCEGPCAIPDLGMTDPAFSYPHAGRDASITGGFVYRGPLFPTGYDGSYFYADYVQNWIRRLTLDAQGFPIANLAFEPETGVADGPYGEIVDLKQGPDGALYYVDIGISWEGTTSAGTVRRIRYTLANAPPVVSAAAIPTSGLAPLTVSFSSVGSVDPDGQPLTYGWTFGDSTTSSEANPVHSYATNGTYTARLTVSDGVLTSVSGPIIITVGNPPVATILTPVPGTTFRAGDTISFSGIGTDPETGPLPPSALTWTVQFLHDSHAHPYLGPISSATGGTFVVAPTGHDYSGNTRYLIILTVTDPDGLQNSSTAVVTPEKVNLTLNTVPTGLSVKVDGITRPTPWLLDTLIGFQHSLEAPNQAQGQWLYTFSSWSDGGAQTHGIVAPESARTYTANYQLEQNSGLMAAYGLNEGGGSSASDSSANDATATLFGATWTTQGRYGGAVSLDGVDDRLVGPTLTLPSVFTLMAWMFNPSDSSYETLVTVGSYRDLFLYGGVLRFDVGSAIYSFGGTIQTGVWHHVALTSDGTNLRAYLDGAPLGPVQPAALAPETAVLQIGAWILGPANYDYFSGLLDEVRIYGRALSQAEIQADMNTPVGSVQGPNQAPMVSAGADQLITLPAAAALDGTVTDDGLPAPPGAMTITWSLVGGPATVTFGNPGAVDTTATFSTPGTYLLRLTAFDGLLTTSDEIIVVVQPPPPTNQPPLVSAGADLTVTLPANALLDGTVTDDGLPIPPGSTTTTWSMVSGPAPVTFATPASVDTTVTFTAPGSYILRLSASDGALSTSDNVSVVVSSPLETIGLIRQNCVGSTNCFTSLAAWEAAYGGVAFGQCPIGDLVCANTVAVAQIDGVWTAPDTAAVTIAGWTTGPANSIRIFTTPAARHDGSSPTGYRMAGSTWRLRIREDYVRVEGLSFVLTATSPTPSLLIDSVNSQSRVEVSGCLFVGNSPGYADGIRVVAGTSSNKQIFIWNNIFRGFSGSTRSAILVSSGIVTLYNNTIVGSRYGIRRTGGTAIAQNNLSYANTTDYAGAFSNLSSNNASRDQTAPAFGTYYRGITVDFVNETGGNYHLAGSDTGARDRGLDLSNVFQQDVDSQIRVVPWDIGADEFVASP